MLNSTRSVTLPQRERHAQRQRDRETQSHRDRETERREKEEERTSDLERYRCLMVPLKYFFFLSTQILRDIVV